MNRQTEKGWTRGRVLKSALVLAGMTSAGLSLWAAAATGPTLSAGRLIVLTGDEFRILNAATGKATSHLVKDKTVNKAALSRDGNTLAAGNLDGSVTLWSVATGKSLHILSGQTDTIESLTFSPDGRTLATGSADTTVKLWNVATGKETLTFSGGVDSAAKAESPQGVEFIAFSPDGKVVASGTDSGWIVIWAAATGKVLLRIAEGNFNLVNTAVFSLDGKTLITGQYDKTVKVWNLATGKILNTLTGHLGRVYTVALSPDGKLIASGGEDRRIKLWNLASGKLIRTLYDDDGTDAVSFSPDGKTLFVMNENGGAKLWNVVSGMVVWTLDPPARSGWLRSTHPVD
ncbi:WD40 repeat domain-containing protein (plasmid) [Deinococcus radiomollis]|uniref:WD40 repeat domain-containing protein n=1 Tax=Deinococcus radiomollis TaxID=468916 RepID=UPI0038929757